MKLNFSMDDINYLLRIIGYNAVDNSEEGVKEDKLVEAFKQAITN